MLDSPLAFSLISLNRLPVNRKIINNKSNPLIDFVQLNLKTISFSKILGTFQLNNYL